MKNFILIGLMFCFFTTLKGQTVNDILIKDLDVEYIELVGSKKLFSTKMIVNINFGQQDKVFKVSDTIIKDQDGNMMNFNSMVDALNFFDKAGYEFQTAYVLATTKSQTTYYIMRKKN